MRAQLGGLCGHGHGGGDLDPANAVGKYLGRRTCGRHHTSIFTDFSVNE
jgi:hypothetical protein